VAKKASVELTVLLKAAGIKATTEQVEKLQQELKETAMANSKTGESMKKTAKATKGLANETKNLTVEQNKSVRAHKGAAEATGRQGKDFSRMAQGMGGLVQVYATIVGNVYALSTAFLVLRNAADLSSMVKSAEDFSNRFGRSVTRITEDIQKATGGALSFAEALPSINKAIAGGFSTEKIESLAVAATKASQTFGGTANEALSRFISAAQRGRTEIVQTLGIVIQTEKVYTSYAISIGKAKDELTAFDKQQAIVNAIIEESQNVFDGLNIDPNPFTQFANTIVDLKDSILTTITDAFTPFISLINKSKVVAFAFMGAIAGMIVRKLLPAVKEMTKNAAEAGLESSRAAARALKSARESAKAAAVETAKTRKKWSLRSDKSDFDRLKRKYAKELSAHKAFSEQLYDQEGKLQTKRLGLINASMAREAKLRESGTMKGRQAAFSGMTDKDFNRLRGYYRQLGAGAFATAKANKEASLAAKSLGNNFVLMGKRGVAAWNSIRAAQVAASSQFKSGYAQVFELTQENFLKAAASTGKGWQSFGRAFMNTNVSMRHSYKKFQAAVGKSSALITGSFTKIANHLSTIMIVLTIASAIWEKYGDSILGVSDKLRTFLDIQKELPDRLAEIDKRTSEYLEKTQGKIPSNLKELGGALTFATGTLQTINEELVTYGAAFKEAMGGQTIAEGKANVDILEKNLDALIKLQDQQKINSITATTRKDQKIAQQEYDRTTREIVKLKKELSSAKKTIESFTNSDVRTEDLIGIFSRASEAAKVAGLNVDSIRDKLTLLADEELDGVKNGLNLLEVAFVEALTTGTEQDAVNAFEKLKQSFEDPAVAAEKLFNIITEGTAVFTSSTGSVEIYRKSLEDVEKDTVNYFKSFERSLLSATGDKAFANLALNIRNNLANFDDATLNENSLAAKLFGNPEELNAIKIFLGKQVDDATSAKDLKEEAANLVETILENERKLIQVEQAKKLNALEQQKVAAATQATSENRLQNLEDSNRLAREALGLDRDQVIALRAQTKERLSQVQNQIKFKKNLEGEALSDAELEVLKGEETRLNNLIAYNEEQETTLNTTIKQKEITDDIIERAEKYVEIQKSIGAELAKIRGGLALNKEKIIKSDLEELSNLRAKQKLERDSINATIRQTQAKVAELSILDEKSDRDRENLVAAQEALKLEKLRKEQLDIQQQIELNLLEIKQKQKDLATDLTIAQQQAKVAAAQIVRSDQSRIDKLSQELKSQERILQIQIQQLEAKKDAAKETAQGDDLARAEASIQAQIDASRELLLIQQELNLRKEAAEPFVIRKETLDRALELQKIQKETVELSLTRSYSLDNEAKKTQIVLNNLEAQYKIQKEQLETEKTIVMLTETNAGVAKQKLAILDAQTDKLKEQYLVELEIAKLNDKAVKLVKDGGFTAGLFTKEGVDTMFAYFELKARQTANKVENLYKVLGDGFYDTVNNTFNTAIDNLLEGGRKFADTVREAFKAGLREMVSTALMNSMKKIFAEVASIKSPIQEIDTSKLPKPKTVEETSASVNKLVSLGKFETELALLRARQGSSADIQDYTAQVTQRELPAINSTLLRIEALLRTPDTLGGPGPVMGGLGQQQPDILGGAGAVLGTGAGIMNADSGLKEFKSIFKGIDDKLAEPLEIEKVGTVESSPDTGVQSGVLGSMLSTVIGEGTNATVGTLLQLIQVMQAMSAAGSGEGGGGWISLIGSLFGGAAANGAIFKGGIKAFADGGMVKAPTIGLIGEGNRNEAVVPLPNNKAIPVDMKNERETVNINMEQNFDFSNSGSDTIAQLRSEARNIEERTFNRVFSEINKGGRYAKIVGRR
jgi:hypothetical protein